MSKLDKLEAAGRLYWELAGPSWTLFVVILLIGLAGGGSAK